MKICAFFTLLIGLFMAGSGSPDMLISVGGIILVALSIAGLTAK